MVRIGGVPCCINESVANETSIFSAAALTATTMHFTTMVPSVFYTNITDGLTLFVGCLQFTIAHNDFTASQPYCVLRKGGIGLIFFQDERLSKEHNPELRFVSDNIEEVYAQVAASHPHLLHPNLNTVILRP